MLELEFKANNLILITKNDQEFKSILSVLSSYVL